MAKGHNKKRNVGLVYEFLVQHMAEHLVEGDEKTANSAAKLLRRYILKKNTELYKEFRLFHALANTTVESEIVAGSLIREARDACKKYNAAKLDKEKSLLIRGINHTFNDPKFYDKRLEEYKIYATIQVLLNEWRKPTPTDFARLAKFEQDVINWLVTEKKKNVLEETPEGVDDLLISMMTKKVNAKYSGVLNKDQISLVKHFSTAERTGNYGPLKECLAKLKSETLNAIDKMKEGEAEIFGSNLKNVRNLVENINEDLNNDDEFVHVLRVAKLKEEILSE